MKKRLAAVARRTAETAVNLKVNLDGKGKTDISTGIGFFDHMLDLLGRHALLDLTVRAEGDLKVDQHHTVEDVGICLGEALRKALGDKRGIRRYGSARVPMDEALAEAAVDLCGRGSLSYQIKIRRLKVGEFPVGLAREFFRALAANAGAAVHLDLVRGEDPHHMLEAVFKACGRALREALEPDPRSRGIPSTKGRL